MNKLLDDFILVFSIVTVVVLLAYAFKPQPKSLSENMSKQTQCALYSKWCFWPECGECE
jgi:hypothetical protein